MEARTEREFAAVMEGTEGAGSTSESDKVIEPHGEASKNGDGIATGHGVEAASVKPPIKKRRVHGPPVAAQVTPLSTVDCGEAIQHVPLGQRTWEYVHAGLVLACTLKLVCVLPGLDPPQHVSLLTEQDG
jgi:hypothetical protein